MKIAPERARKVHGMDSQVICHRSNGNSAGAALAHDFSRLYQPGRHMAAFGFKGGSDGCCEIEATAFDQFDEESRAVLLEYSPSYSGDCRSCFGVADDKGNGNTGIKQPSDIGRWRNCEKPTAAVVKSVPMRCTRGVIDERAGPIQTILVARLSDVRSPHD